MDMRRSAWWKAALILGLGAFITAIPMGAAIAAPTLPNGFTAKVIASSGDKISGTIDATGYDVGVYIGPGVSDVTVERTTISGANDEGILVQDASDIIIKNNLVENNALNPAAGIDEIKGIALVGSTGVLVKDNRVINNQHGGIGLYDDGPNSPFAPTAINQTAIAGTDNVITRNLVKDNGDDCGIVVSAKNPGGGVADNLVSMNLVLAFDPAAGDTVPGTGGIIVAGGSYGPVNVTNNTILRNVVRGGLIPGISIHASGPGVITGTHLIGNLLSDNGSGAVSKRPTGIEIFAAPVGKITDTQVLHNAIANDYYGVWHVGDKGTHIAHLQTLNVTIPVFPP